MALSVTDLNSILLKRTSKYLTAAGFVGNDADLVDPLRWALSMLGVTTASLTAIVDADLITINGIEIDALLDLAELRTLEISLGNLTSVTVKAGPVTQNLSDLAKNLISILDTKRKGIIARYKGLLVLPLDDSAAKTVTLWAM